MSEANHFVTNENGRIALYVSEPPEQAQRVVVCIHGGPGGDRRGNDDVFEQLKPIFLATGSIYIQFDMYGVGQSEGQEQDISVRSQTIDYRSVIEFAAAEFSLPIWAVGESMGGTIVALNWDDRISRYVMLWPAFDLEDTDLRPYLTEEWAKELDERGFINDDGVIIGGEFYNEIKGFDGRRHLPMPDSPMFFAHGVTDESVPFQQSQDAISEARSPVTFLVVPGGNHGLQDPSARKLLYNSIESWISI